MISQYLNGNVRDFYLKNRGVASPENSMSELDSALFDIRENKRVLRGLYVEAAKLTAETSTSEYAIGILQAINRHGDQVEVSDQIESMQEEYKVVSAEKDKLMKLIVATERNIHNLNLKAKACEIESTKALIDRAHRILSD